ncbi:ATP-binding protein [uncultured Algibacter sp.]|uniref:tetratricopeptide repeat-containing hybrid sensor histidine kinase/response regulator n=1 Tax=uncultured Algibacter sp. TaxID=298659 RepID=UPI002623DB5D|nr:ATP-binding protein [uncultured Algibacter sp.]
MKTILLVSFLSFTILSFGKNDRDIIKEIDDINSSAIVSLNDKEIVKSFKEFIIAKTLSDSIQDNYGSAVANYNLGNIYNLMENYDSAKEYYFLSLTKAKIIDDNYLIASIYKNLAEINKDENNFAKAHQFLMNALKFTAKKNLQTLAEVKKLNTVEFEIRLNLSELYIAIGKSQEALINLLKVGDYIKNNSVISSDISYYNYIYGTFYTHKELYNNANTKFKKAIALIENDKESTDYMLLSKIYKQLSLSLAKSGNNADAFLNLLKHNNYKEKYLNEEKVKQNLIIKSKFLIEDYKNNAQKANSERLLQLEVANKIKKVNVIVIIALLLLIISLIIICFGYISKRKMSSKLELRNKQLIIAKNEALKSSELKTKFISNVSHELRTPLYGVVGITSLLLENSTLGNRDKKYIKSLKHSGDYLLNLINDILQFGKMEAGKVELKNTSVNLESTIEHIVNSFEYKLQETNNHLKVSIDKGVPETIKCDKIRLSQILINLIGNSVKFTNNGTINLRVKLINTKDNLVNLCFEVEDNGVGIPENKFNSIFDNFSQLKDSNINYQGTGLGLSITKKLIELFKSTIKLESEEGVGTKFSFNIEFEIDKLKTENRLHEQDLNKIKSLINPNETCNILLAEDNKINQIVTKKLLEKQNYKCTIVENGRDALFEAKNNSYDLILMDINMPIMNGNEATETIREFNKNIPIIALTAADIEEVKQNYNDIGYNKVITKPFDNYEFYQTINENIQKSKKKEFVNTQAS